jgi:colicin import membrane protein
MKKILKKLKADDKNTGIIYPYPEEMGDGENSSMQFFQAVLVTFIAHLIIIAALILAPPLSLKKSHTPTVVSVRMVSMGDLRPEGSSEKKQVVEVPSEPKKAPAEKPESIAKAAEAKVVEPQVTAPVVAEKKVAVEKKPVAPPIPEERPPEVSLASKEISKEKPEEKPKEPPKVKTSLKKETFQPSKVVQSAIEKIEKETKGPSSEDLKKDALARLEKKVAETPSGSTGEKSQSEGGSGGGARGKGSGSGFEGEGVGSAKEVYNGLIAYHIQKNWAFSEQLARGQNNLETLVGIKILSNGEILDVWIDKKSGNQYLDESAIRAIKKSNPLPPLPKEIGVYDYKVGLRFTPQGLDG